MEYSAADHLVSSRLDHVVDAHMFRVGLRLLPHWRALHIRPLSGLTLLEFFALDTSTGIFADEFFAHDEYIPSHDQRSSLEGIHLGSLPW